jgi:serine/threonine protein kinase/Leucine-rich repeat (LRR) protein
VSDAPRKGRAGAVPPAVHLLSLAMPLPLEQFVQQLEDSGILAEDTLADFVPPNASPKDADELAKELVRHKKLTRFQAIEVAKGNARSLVLGNYVLLEKIGAGGMGQVFQARHRRMDRIVAVKLLPAAMTQNSAAIARFEREVKAAARLTHPNIVTAFDADCADGVHFLVMEYVEGRDLAALVKRDGPFPVDQALHLVLQAARGLEAAHADGIVHRDIKPGNLLLDKRGTVKILDMGLARINAVEDGQARTELTEAGTVMGTIDYMAPEQARDVKTADARADIYSLGCTLFYLLTGRAAYEGDSPMTRLVAHRTRPIPSLRAACPQASEQVDAIFQRMLAKEVADRYQSMGEVIAALEELRPRREEAIGTQVSIRADADTDLTNFLHEIVLEPPPPLVSRMVAPARKPRWNKDWIKNNRQPLLIGAGVLVLVVLLAGLANFLRPLDGTLIVTVSEPGALVRVLDAAGEVEVALPGGQESLSIAVDPGKHRLQIEKDGFELFTRDFEIESGGEQTIMARLVSIWGKSVDESPPLEFETPEFVAWKRQVAALPAEEQVKAVADKLQELNPGFDGQVTHKVENGGVTELTLLTDDVTDLSPVRALAGLRFLACAGTYTTQANGKLSDLSPLAGLPLVTLHCGNTQVADLTPLAGMPLENLSCHNCRRLETLSGLEGLPLKSLSCFATAVADLKPLEGLALTELECSNSPVADLSPLAGMPLVWLNCGATRVADLSPLAGMPLTRLHCGATSVTDLSPLVGLLLTELTCDFLAHRDTELLRSITTLETINGKPAAEFWQDVEAQQAAFDAWLRETAALPAEERVQAVDAELRKRNPGFDGLIGHRIENDAVTVLGFFGDRVTDISPVRALPELKILHCQGSNGAVPAMLSDLSPLRGLRLNELQCYRSAVNDLSPLIGMPLTFLNCQETRVSDLSPLAGMPLTTLFCHGTKVTDLAPLAGMPLEFLHCGGTSPLDLSVLAGMPLKDFAYFGAIGDDLSPLADLPLTKIHIPFRQRQHADVLRSIRTLETINNKPAAEFWKEIDDQAALFQAWAGQVAAMPPKAQVQAVANRLRELNPGYDGTLAPVIADDQVRELTMLVDNVSDLSPLRALAHLRVLNCQVVNPGPRTLADLWSLNGMALTTLSIPGTAVSDLSPLKGMPLETLSFPGNKVSDLSPLRGMPLNYLHIEGAPVSDLSPLKGMPLSYLNCQDTLVADLSPLRGMQLNTLACRHTQVTDLSPLEGMPLAFFTCHNTQVTDLSPLKGMPLTTLVFYNTKVADLSPLAGMPLSGLTISGTRVTDLTPLQDTPIASIQCDFVPWRDAETLRSIKTLTTINGKPAAAFWNEIDTGPFVTQEWIAKVTALPPDEQLKAVAQKLQACNPGFNGRLTGLYDMGAPAIENGVVTQIGFLTDKVTDISPLRALTGLRRLDVHGNSGQGKLSDLSPLAGMRLEVLYAIQTQVSDLTPLAGMPLAILRIEWTQVSDLSPLTGMRLTELNIDATKVTDLSPLAGMPLTSLLLNFTRVSDLSPLQGMSLTWLELLETPVTDFSPVAGMPVENLTLDFDPARHTDLLRSFKNLATINRKPAAEFWKEVEAGNEEPGE